MAWASPRREAVSASALLAFSRSASVAPMTSRVMITTANPLWASCTRSVAVSPPRGTVPATAPAVPIAPTRKQAVATPSCLNRRAAQRSGGKITT